MKKRNVNSLTLNKKSISNLTRKNSINGGRTVRTCLLCCPTIDVPCPTVQPCDTGTSPDPTDPTDLTDPILGACV